MIDDTEQQIDEFLMHSLEEVKEYFDSPEERINAGLNTIAAVRPGLQESLFRLYLSPVEVEDKTKIDFISLYIASGLIDIECDCDTADADYECHMSRYTSGDFWDGINLAKKGGDSILAYWYLTQQQKIVMLRNAIY